MLYSKNSAPIGKPASFNYERYLNPDVDALFDQYATADEAGQVDIIKKVGAAMLRDVPIIPTTESVNWFQYNTADIAGWPTEADPYAQPAAFNVPGRRAGAAAPLLEVGAELTDGAGGRHEILLRRLGFFLLTLWAALTLNFFIPRFMPGSPLQALRDRTHDRLSPAALEQMLTSYGFKPNENVVVQYVDYLKNMVTGHWGISIGATLGEPVTTDRPAGAAVDARAGRGHHRAGVPARLADRDGRRLAARRPARLAAAAGRSWSPRRCRTSGSGCC